MTINRIDTANNIINRAAAEIGLTPAIDPYSSPDDAYGQLRAFLNTAGEELCTAYPWEFLNANHQVTTADTDSGDYPLPSDFLYMIPQTGWEQTNRTPLFGPLSPQDWAYLEGRKLASNTIYASFRLREGLFSIFPQPPPNGLDINFQYQSKNWVRDDSGGTPVYSDLVTTGTQVPLFDKVLLSRYLKVKYYEAKGFDSSKAQADFNSLFAMLTNQDKTGGIINAGRGGRGFPYLDYRNAPDTNYGGPGA